MLRYSVFRPEGEMTCQPRATLWEPVFQRKRMPCKGAAILGYCDVAVPVKNRILFRPHRARTLVVDVFPGRCPGLICDCPVRGEDPKALHQNAPESRSAMPRAGRCRRRSPVRRANVVRPSRFQYRCERSGPIDPRVSFARPAASPIGRWSRTGRGAIVPISSRKPLVLRSSPCESLITHDKDVKHAAILIIGKTSSQVAR
jgi:hypothetical protein